MHTNCLNAAANTKAVDDLKEVLAQVDRLGAIIISDPDAPSAIVAAEMISITQDANHPHTFLTDRGARRIKVQLFARARSVNPPLRSGPSPVSASSPQA
jgi:hypothetical protein